MKILITGICGFVGQTLAGRIKREHLDDEVFGLDNLMRPGSELNRRLSRQDIRVQHGDVRCMSDLETLPTPDWVIDAAANPSVLAGLGQSGSSRQLVEHNLFGTLNLLEFCRQRRAGLILLSTSRVYSIPELARIPVRPAGERFVLPENALELSPGLSMAGIAEHFSTKPPLSLYGATKLASETMALEYGLAFGFPVLVNRCGVLAGAGQFGTAEQGIFSYWIHAWRSGRPLRYIGFGGKGYQVRDALHPEDLADLVLRQLRGSWSGSGRIWNVAGGLSNSMSLLELSDWCRGRFGNREVGVEKADRPFDVPWVILDASRAAADWRWHCRRPLAAILEEIADHAEHNPNWLDLTKS